MKRVNVAVLISEFEDPFTYNLCLGTLSAAKEKDYNIYFFPGKFLDEKYSPDIDDDFEYQDNCVFQFIDQNSIDVAVFALGDISSGLTELEKEEIVEKIPVPVIMVSDRLENVSSVNFDNSKDVISSVEHLVQSHKRKHFAYISGDCRNLDAEERRNAFIYAMDKCRFSPDEYRIVQGDFGYTEEKIIEDLLDEFTEIDAIVCANDSIAFNVYDVLRNRNISIGQEISVVGFDDAPYASRIKPGLTTVKADPKLLGYEAVRLCDRVLAGEIVHYKTSTSLLCRESCGCQNKGSSYVFPDVDMKSHAVNQILVSISGNVMNYEEENSHIYAMILKSLCRLNIKSAYLYTFIKDIEHRKDEYWEKPEQVLLQTYFVEKYPRKPGVLYQPMPIQYYTVSDDEIIEVPDEEKVIPFSQIFDNPFVDNSKNCAKVVTLLYAGEIQYGFIVWEADVEYFPFISKLSYQIANALKTNRLLSSKNEMSKALESMLSEVQEKNSILEEISKIDELTQLYNRRGFLDMMKRNVIALENSGRRAVAIYADMNDLKKVNDQFGHEEGDYALKTIGQMLRDAIHCDWGKGTVGRIGGDEFCAYLIVNRDVSMAMNEVEKAIRERVLMIEENENKTNGKEYYIGMTLGIKHFVCGSYVDVSEELEQADAQLYIHKKNKRTSILKDDIE